MTPKNLFTEAVADGKEVAVPNITPEASVTVGDAALSCARDKAARRIGKIRNMMAIAVNCQC